MLRPLWLAASEPMMDEPIRVGDVMVKRDGPSRLLLRVTEVDEASLSGVFRWPDGAAHAVRGEPLAIYRHATDEEIRAAREHGLFPS